VHGITMKGINAYVFTIIINNIIMVGGNAMMTVTGMNSRNTACSCSSSPRRVGRDAGIARR
jgi:hypothetical protein